MRRASVTVVSSRFRAPELERKRNDGPNAVPLLVQHDARHELLAATAARRGAANGCHGIRGAGACANGLPDGSVGDGVAVANQHG